MTYTKREIRELEKGFHPHVGDTRKKRREKEALTVNNRKGLIRVREVHFPGYHPSKVKVRKQYIEGKLIVHYN